MDALTLYTLSTSAYLTLQSTPLLLTPRLITSLLTTTTTSTPQPTTDLETYLSRTLALTLLALAALNLILTGVLPSTTSPPPATDDENGVGNGGLKNPYAYPTLTITTTYHAFSAFYLYTNIASPRGGLTFGFGAGLTLSAGLFCLGLWVLLFGGEKARVSKTTGADKRTGNFPFENRESSREKKREKESSGKRKSVSSKLR